MTVKNTKQKKDRRNTNDPFIKSVSVSAREARAHVASTTQSLFSFSSIKLALTLGVFLGLGTIFFISGAFGETRFNLTLTTNPTLEDGLVGHWTFDGEDITVNQILDRSGNANHGGFFGGAATTAGVAGKIGQALAFDGVNDYINIPDDSSLEGMSSATWAAWIKREGSGALQMILNKGENVYKFRLNASNKLQLYASGVHYISDNIAPLGEWMHGVVTYDGSNVRIYEDGAIVKTIAKTGDIETQIIDARIGIQYDNVSPFDGIIDDVRLYNRALSADEIKRLYELGATTHVNTTITTNPTLEDGLVGHWTFDGKDINDTDGIADRSGNGNNAYYLNGATTTATGVMGQGIAFDPAAGNKIVHIPTDFDLEDVSVSVWFKSSDTATKGIFGKWESNSDKRWYLLYDGGPSNVRLVDNIDAPLENLYTTSVSRGDWHHAVAMMDSLENKLYIDGTLVGSGNFASTTWSFFDAEFQFGSRGENDGGGVAMFGSMDDARIYNRALSADEVKRLYELGATTRVNTTLSSGSLSDGLVSHWTFDGGSITDTSITDGSGNGNTAYVQGVATSSLGFMGKAGQAATFDGVDDFVDVANVDVTGEFTLSTWFKKPIGEKSAFFLSLGGSSVGGGKVGLGAGGTRIIFIRVISGGVGAPPNPSDGPADQSMLLDEDDGEWHFLLFTRDSSDKVDGYLDGGSAQRLFSDAAQSGTVQLSAVGAHEDGGQAFEGQVDDVRFYNRKLSEEEIKRLYEFGR